MSIDPGVTDDTRQRWLGLRSYEESDSDLFFGRDDDGEKLFRMIRREILTTVFAPSGTGKTSLLRAGLFPAVRAEKYLPVWIRLDHTEAVPDHGKYIRERIEHAANADGLEIASIVPPQTDPDEETFWEYMHRVEFWDNENELVTPIVVLDQFEEVFTIGKTLSKTDDFLRELADVVQKRIPNALRQRLRRDQQKLKIPTETQSFRFVLSLRQDYVAQLDTMQKSMPAIMRNRYPLEQMTGDQAMQAVLGPGEGVVTESVARRVVEIVGGTAAGEPDNSPRALENIAVEPNHLSLMCHELNQSRIRSRKSQITADGLQEQSRDIVRRFYQESFDGLDSRAQVFVEENLLTSTGFRKPQPLDDAEMRGLTPEARKQLVDRHVLRIDDRQGMSNIELTHDLLTGVVQESRDQRHEEEEKDRLRSERRAERKRRQAYGVVCCILLAFLSGAVFLAIRASRAEKIAAKHAIAAEESARTAEENRKSADKLVSFMTNDLYESLLPIGRLDLLHEVAQKAESHLEKTDLDLLTSESRMKQAQARSHLANLLLRQGYLTDCMKAQEQAIEILKSGEETRSSKTSLTLKSIRIDYADMHGELGNPNRAIEILNSISDAEGLSKEKLSHLEVTTRKYLSLGRVQMRLGMFADAQASLALALTACEQRKQSSSRGQRIWNSAQSHSADLRLELARLAAVNQNFPAAFQSLGETLKDVASLLKDDSANTELILQRTNLMVELGRLHLAVGDPIGAKDKLLPALDVAQQQAEIVANPGNDNAMDSKSGKPRWARLLARVRRELGRTQFIEHQMFQGQSSNNESEDSSWQEHFEGALELADSAPKNTLNQLLRAETRSEYGTFLVEKLVTQSSDESDSDLFELAAKQFREARQISQEELGGEATKNTSSIVACALVCKDASIAFDSSRARIESEWFDEANTLFKKAIDQCPNWLRLFQHRAELLEAHAKWLHREGQVLEAIKLLEEALVCRRHVHDKDSSVKSRTRSLAHALWNLADFYQWSDPLNKSTDGAIKYLRESADKYFSLAPDEKHLWVDDRLKAARSLFHLSQLLRESGKEAGALQALRRASDLGFSDATNALSQIDTNSDLSLAHLAMRQETRKLLIPCTLTDRLVNETGGEATRDVLTTVTVTGPIPEIDFEDSALSKEMERIETELMLTLDDEIRNELVYWWERLARNPETKTSLAELTELAIAVLDESEKLVVLEYPDRASATIIGTECNLEWKYLGSQRDQLKFRVQVSKDASFKDLLVSKDVPGTSFRCPFQSEASGLNSTLYWRVRALQSDLPASSPSESNESWSDIGKFEIYESLVARVETTKELRIGIFEFDGDLLEWEPGKKEPKGFNGELINFIRAHLSNRFFDNSKTLKLVPYKYSWTGLFEAASRAEIDCAVSVITRTKERERQWGISFTEPYFETRFALVSSAKNPIDSLETLRDRKASILVNENFRGEMAAEILARDTNKVDPRTYQKVDLLIDGVIKEVGAAAITDHAFVDHYFRDTNDNQENHQKRKKVRIVQLTNSDYERSYDGASDEQRTSLNNMVNDYGGAEFEQYAVAMSSHADLLRRAVNEAILKFRETEASDACKRAQLPSSDRLYKGAQIGEEKMRVPSVIPDPNQELLQSPFVIGDEIKFKLYSIDIDPKRFFLQIATSSEFNASTIIKSISGTTSDFSVSVSDDTPEGVLFWRAKGTTRENDLYPHQGWCEPAKFEFYRSCQSRIRSTKKVRVAVNLQNGESVFRNENGRLDGFDVRITRMLTDQLKKQMGMNELQPQFVEMNFNQIFGQVRSKSVDIALAGITATDGRKKQEEIEFSEPYCKTYQAAVWAKGSAFDGLDSLINKTFIVAGRRTRAFSVANGFGPKGNIRGLESNDRAERWGSVPKEYLLKQLTRGTADAAVMDYPTAIAAQKRQDNPNEFVIQAIRKEDIPKSIKIDPIEDNYAVAFPKEEKKLAEMINKSVRAWKENGELQAIFDEYRNDEGELVFEVE